MSLIRPSCFEEWGRNREGSTSSWGGQGLAEKGLSFLSLFIFYIFLSTFAFLVLLKPFQDFLPFRPLQTVSTPLYPFTLVDPLKRGLTTCSSGAACSSLRTYVWFWSLIDWTSFFRYQFSEKSLWVLWKDKIMLENLGIAWCQSGYRGRVWGPRVLRLVPVLCILSCLYNGRCPAQLAKGNPPGCRKVVIIDDCVWRRRRGFFRVW